MVRKQCAHPQCSMFVARGEKYCPSHQRKVGAAVKGFFTMVGGGLKKAATATGRGFKRVGTALGKARKIAGKILKFVLRSLGWSLWIASAIAVGLLIALVLSILIVLIINGLGVAPLETAATATPVRLPAETPISVEEPGSGQVIPNSVVPGGIQTAEAAVGVFNGVPGPGLDTCGSACVRAARAYMGGEDHFGASLPIWVELVPEGDGYRLRGSHGEEGFLQREVTNLSSQIACRCTDGSASLYTYNRSFASVAVWVFSWGAGNQVILRVACGNFALERGELPEPTPTPEPTGTPVPTETPTPTATPSPEPVVEYQSHSHVEWVGCATPGYRGRVAVWVTKLVDGVAVDEGERTVEVGPYAPCTRASGAVEVHLSGGETVVVRWADEVYCPATPVAGPTLTPMPTPALTPDPPGW